MTVVIGMADVLLVVADWMEIRTNHMVVITPKMNLLQIPIVDEFYVAGGAARTTEFAREKGLLPSMSS